MKDKILTLLGLILGLTLTLLIMYITSLTTIILSSKLIEMLILSSITAVGSGLIGLQIERKNRYLTELKKDVLDTGILMLLCLVFGILYLATNNLLIGMLSVLFFVWGIIQLLIILVFERVDLYRKILRDGKLA